MALRGRVLRRNQSPLVSPAGGASTAIGIRDTYRLARSCGVGIRHPRSLFVSCRPARRIERRCSMERPVTRCATTKVMIFSCQEIPTLSASSRRFKKRMSEKTQAAEGMPEPDRDKTDFGYGLSLVSLISPSPPHGQDTRGCRHSHLHGRGRKPDGNTAERTPLVGASALHGVSGTESQKPLGLNPWVREELS